MAKILYALHRRRVHKLTGNRFSKLKGARAQEAQPEMPGGLPKKHEKKGAMYTGRSIEDLLELVLGLVERVGELVFVAPTTTVPPPQKLRNQGELNGQSVGD